MAAQTPVFQTPVFRETRWWWIRHAPVINPDGHIYGQGDLPADVSAVAQFRSVAARLPAGAVWLCTPLQRTRQTLDALVAHHVDAPPVEVHAAFMEQHFGDWQGQPRDVVYGQLPAVHPFWLSPADARPPNGESFVDLMGRVHPLIETLSAQHEGRDIVAVTHGGTIRAAVALALDLDPETALRVSVANVSLTRLDHLVLHDGHEGERQPVWRVGGINQPPG